MSVTCHARGGPRHFRDFESDGGETGIRKAWVPERVAATAEVGETEESLAQLRKGGTDVRAPWQRAWVAAGHSAGQ